MGVKIKTTIDKQIEIFKSRKIKFNIVDEQKARIFLKDKTYYFKLSAYRENFDYNKLSNGEIEYKDLEFAYLVEISKIDMYLRYTVLEWTLDIEHFLKRWIVNDCTEDKNDDGYVLVNEFLQEKEIAKKNIEKHSKSPYSYDLIRKYKDSMPLWVFAEVSTFGDFLYFYMYYCEHKKILPPVDKKLLNSIKSLRNACAHNNCIINKLDKNIPPTTNINAKVKQWCIELLGDCRKTTINNMLKRQVVNDFITMLYVFTLLSSDKVIGKKVFRLFLLFHKRIIKNKHYFKKNQRLINVYKFVLEIIMEMKKIYCKNGIIEKIKSLMYL